MKKALAILLFIAVIANAQLQPTWWMPSTVLTISGGAIYPDSAFIGKLVLPDQGPGYLVQNSAGSQVTDLNCTSSQLAGFNGGGSASFFSVITGPSFFAIGGAGTIIKTTVNGSTYTDRASGMTSSIRAGTYGLSKFVFVGTPSADSTNGITTSSDGITWAGVKSVHGSVSYNDGACNLTTCVIIGAASAVATTTDLLTFTRQTGFGGSLSISSVTWSGDLSLFTAVTSTGVIKTSPDGVTWTTQTTPGGVTNLWWVDWNDALNLLVAVGNGGKIITSTNGTAWTLQTSPSTAPLYSVFSAGSTLIAMGDSLTILKSTNGTAWTAVSPTPAATNELYSGGFLGSTYISVGETGRIYTSSDATTWTRSGVVQPACQSTVGEDEVLRVNGNWTATGIKSFPGAVLVGDSITIGVDTKWYRSAANTLRTPDAVTIDGLLTGAGANLSGQVFLGGATLASVPFGVRYATDENLFVRHGIDIGGTGIGLDALNDGNTAVIPFTVRGDPFKIVAPSTQITGTLTTGAPNTGTAAPWKLGIIVTAACVLDATTYAEIDISGTFRKVALCQ